MPSCQIEQHHLDTFGSGGYEKNFCEIILILDELFRRCCFKISLICSSVG